MFLSYYLIIDFDSFHMPSPSGTGSELPSAINASLANESGQSIGLGLQMGLSPYCPEKARQAIDFKGVAARISPHPVVYRSKTRPQRIPCYRHLSRVQSFVLRGEI